MNTGPVSVSRRSAVAPRGSAMVVPRPWEEGDLSPSGSTCDARTPSSGPALGRVPPCGGPRQTPGRPLSLSLSLPPFLPCSQEDPRGWGTAPGGARWQAARAAYCWPAAAVPTELHAGTWQAASVRREWCFVTPGDPVHCAERARMTSGPLPARSLALVLSEALAPRCPAGLCPGQGGEEQGAGQALRTATEL